MSLENDTIVPDGSTIGPYTEGTLVVVRWDLMIGMDIPEVETSTAGKKALTYLMFRFVKVFFKQI